MWITPQESSERPNTFPMCVGILCQADSVFHCLLMVYVLWFEIFADLLSDCLLPTCLSRDRRPCVRSISWSPLGMAPNSGYEIMFQLTVY